MKKLFLYFLSLSILVPSFVAQADISLPGAISCPGWTCKERKWHKPRKKKQKKHKTKKHTDQDNNDPSSEKQKKRKHTNDGNNDPASRPS